MIEGKDVRISFDGGATWEPLGEQFVRAPEGRDVTPIAVDLGFPSGSFSISGTLEFKARNYQLEEMARWCPRVVAFRSPDSRPWLKRKKGRATYGY